MLTKIILEEELIVGEPLPWNIYGIDNELLLHQGYVLGSKRQKEVLLSRGVFRESADEELAVDGVEEQSSNHSSVECPFFILDTLKVNLKGILTDITNSVVGDYNHKITKLADNIQRLCNENSDPALGAMHLDQNSPYTNVHPILCAILTELLIRRQNIPPKDRLLYISAALTQNIGMLELQQQLSNQTEKLTDAQRKAIRDHPHKSKEMLQSVGIDHKEWLDTVLHHHERPDGSGYPLGLKGKEISMQAKILSVADIYSAMILPRNYRDAFNVKKALKDIFLQRGKLVDEKTSHLLIKEIGIYPPGTFVKLVNGDIAIVIKRATENVHSPLVLSIMCSKGDLFETPKERETLEKEDYAIKEVVHNIGNIRIYQDEIWDINNP